MHGSQGGRVSQVVWRTVAIVTGAAFIAIALLVASTLHRWWQTTPATITAVQPSAGDVYRVTPVGATVTVTTSRGNGLTSRTIKVVSKSDTEFAGSDGVTVSYASVIAVEYRLPNSTRAWNAFWYH